MSRGATLAVTEMTPWPPSSISGSAVASSPLKTRNSRGLRRISSEPRSRLAVASLMPTMFGNLREPQHGVVLHVGDRAAGHVVEDVRQVHRLGDRLEVAVQALPASGLL